MFQSKGSEPQWKRIYDHLKLQSIGYTLTHEKLKDLSEGVAPTSVHSNLYRAMRELENENQRTLINVRGVGYRIAEPREHENLARGKHKAARRRIRDAQRKVASADRSLLTDDELRRLNAIEHHLARHASMLKQLDDKQRRTEERVERTAERVAYAEKKQLQVEDRVDRMEAALRKLGMWDDDDSGSGL